mgnify:CR=1 FL=1
MATREEMVRTLDEFCDGQEKCSVCLLNKFSCSNGDSWDFDEWSDDKLAIAYDHVRKNGETRLDSSHLKEQSDKPDEAYDVVSRPKHYNQGGIECIECIKAAVTNKVGIEAVCVANVIKYLFRYEEKNGVEDVHKAKWYIDRLLKEMEEK